MISGSTSKYAMSSKMLRALIFNGGNLSLSILQKSGNGTMVSSYLIWSTFDLLRLTIDFQLLGILPVLSVAEYFRNRESSLSPEALDSLALNPKSAISDIVESFVKLPVFLL
jgi:hypothetical protein